MPINSDHDALLDHCALECMHAIQKKDVKGFREALKVLVSDLMDEMNSESGPEPKPEIESEE